MAWIVSIDLSSQAGSLSLFQASAGNGGADGIRAELCEEVVLSGALKHSEELFGALEALLAPEKIRPSGVSSWWMNEGPGSFTGLRIAFAAVKGMALATPTQVVLVNGAEVRARSWLAAHPDCIKRRIQVCTVSTATRILCHRFRIPHQGATALEFESYEMVESKTKLSDESSILLVDSPELARNENGIYWPSRSSALLMADSYRVLSRPEEIAAATPVYYAAREFKKQADVASSINGADGRAIPQ